MTRWKGFWSYVHDDDDAERGRISQLARDLGSQFEMLTGESVEIFLDRDAIAWGENWRSRVNEGLATVAFFIPVITPRYFMSVECRRELQFFARKARDLGVSELVMPLLYVDFPGRRAENPTDDLMELVRTFQWEDWTDLRFSDPASEAYRRGVAQLAARLVDANRQAETVAAAVEVAAEEEEEAGAIDRLADMERAIPQWTTTVEAVGNDVKLVGELMSSATKDLERADVQGKGYAGRLTIARKLAKQLEEPAERILAGGKEFTSQLHRIDDGVRLIIENARGEVESSPEARETICAFFRALRSLSVAARDGLGGAEGFIRSTHETEALSRDLRPVLRKMRQGLTTMLEGREVTDEWMALMDESGVACEDTEPALGNGTLG